MRKTRSVIKTDKPLNDSITTLEDLGVAIRYKRTSLGLSIKKTSSLCGISDKTLQAIEKGNESKFSTILNLTNMLGLKFKISGL
jgi:transcriptional regulator with XRE-family HTH domain